MAEISRLPGPVADLWDWQLRGLCRRENPDVFFHLRVSVARPGAAATRPPSRCARVSGARPVPRARAAGARALRRVGRDDRGRARGGLRDRVAEHRGPSRTGQRAAPRGERPAASLLAESGDRDRGRARRRGSSCSFFSTTKVSVVRIIEAIDAALRSADRVTLTGSMTPALTRSPYSPVSALNPWPLLVGDLGGDDVALLARVLGDPAQRLVERLADDRRAGGLVAGQREVVDGRLAGVDEGRAATGDDALLDRRAGRRDGVLDAVLLLLGARPRCARRP